MNEKVSSTLALSSSALLWTVHYFGSPWAAWSKKPKIFLSPKGLRQKTEIFSLLSLSPKGLRKISTRGQVSEQGRTRPSVRRFYPTTVHFSRTPSENPPFLEECINRVYRWVPYLREVWLPLGWNRGASCFSPIRF